MESTTPEISVVIPTYKEHEYVPATLEELAHQTAVEDGTAEIVVADYDPDNDGLTHKAIQESIIKTNLRYVRVHGKGIAHARDIGIRNSLGRYVVCFDADTRFSVPDALVRMVRPMKDNPNILFTCCDNVFPPDEIDVNSPPATYLKACCLIQRMSPICCLEPGLTFLRSAYDSVGGFDDVNWAEGLRLTSKLAFNYGAVCKQYVDDVFVWTSARRAKKLNELGLGVFDYTNAIRGNEIHKT